MEFILSEFRGRDVLISYCRVPKGRRLDDLFYYEMRYGDDDLEPETLEKSVLSNYFGCLISYFPIKEAEKDCLELNDEDRDYLYDINHLKYGNYEAIEENDFELMTMDKYLRDYSSEYAKQRLIENVFENYNK